MNPSLDPEIPASLGTQSTDREPFLTPPDFALEAVLGPDDRKQVSSTNAQDLRILVRLRVTIPGFPVRRATGFLIGPSTILTCAHVLCLRRTDGRVFQAESALAAPGAAGLNNYPFGDHLCEGITVPPQYLANQDPLFDFGVIHLPQPIGASLGFFGVRVFQDQHLTGKQFVLAGFPDPEPAVQGRGPILEDTLWGSMGPMTGTPQFLTHSIDATTGQSGAPLYSKFSEGGKTVFLAAGLQISGNFNQNFALRFRHDMITFLKPLVV